MLGLIGAIIIQSITIFILLYFVHRGLFADKNNYYGVFLLSATLVTVSAIGSSIGMLGSFAAWIINLFIIIKTLAYDLSGAILFALGLTLLNLFIISLI